MLEDVPINTGEIRRFLADMIRENLTELGVGRVNEITDDYKTKNKPKTKQLEDKHVKN